MKLIKLSTDHYIVVDDSEIKEGDWFIDVKKPLRPRQIKTKHLLEDLFDSEKKITYSTQPLESVSLYNTSTGDISEGLRFLNVKQLFLSEVKELIGEIEVDDKAIEAMDLRYSAEPEEDRDRESFFNGFKTGYNQCLEDNKDKKYTEEDLRKAFVEGVDSQFVTVNMDSLGKRDAYRTDVLNDFIESLQPKTEWEVEFVDGKLKMKS